MKNSLHKKIGGVWFFVGLFGLLACGTAFGDMGAIHISAHGVNVTEPAQKAVIFHNGFEEVLILETDIKASKKTGVLRFLPLPSEPVVELAPDTAFQKVGALVRSKDLKVLKVFQTKGGSSTTQSAPVVEAISHKKLGAHDLTVIKINDAGHFRKWVRDYFSRKQLGTLGDNKVIDEMVRDYVQRGISYFAFDFVQVGASDTSIAPLAYRFKTKKIYYPLKTSNSVGGDGKVQLFFVANNAVDSPMLTARAHAWSLADASQPVKFSRFDFSTVAELTPDEAAGVYPGLRGFFEDSPIVLQCATYSGRLSFAEDLHKWMVEQYNPARDSAPSQNAAKPEAGEDESLESLMQHGVKPWHRRDSAVEKAAAAEYTGRSLAASVPDSSVYIASAGRTVRLADGAWEEGGTRVELRLIATGDLSGGTMPDVAVLADVTRDGKTTCELSVLKGERRSGIPVVSEPRSNLTIGLDQGDVRAMSVSKNRIHLKPRGAAPMDYAIRGDKLERITE